MNQTYIVRWNPLRHGTLSLHHFFALFTEPGMISTVSTDWWFWDNFWRSAMTLRWCRCRCRSLWEMSLRYHFILFWDLNGFLVLPEVSTEWCEALVTIFNAVMLFEEVVCSLRSRLRYCVRRAIIAWSNSFIHITSKIWFWIMYVF